MARHPSSYRHAKAGNSPEPTPRQPRIYHARTRSPHAEIVASSLGGAGKVAMQCLRRGATADVVMEGLGGDSSLGEVADRPWTRGEPGKRELSAWGRGVERLPAIQAGTIALLTIFYIMVIILMNGQRQTPTRPGDTSTPVWLV
ncbi:hypothetical protein JHW43_003751 [Diplocarpon mali]|nr:hypothetical protein JHW43_003751 [Diplocarpon mali]